MIRSSRLFFFGRKNYNVPLLTQRAALLPKQVYMEFSVIMNTKTASEEEKIKLLSHDKRKENFLEKISPTEFLESKLAYSFLKVILKGEPRKDKLTPNGELRGFLQKVVLNNEEEIIKLLKILALSNNRAVPVLKVICDTLVSRSYNFTEKECSDLLFSLAKLSYRHEGILKVVLSHLKYLRTFESPKTVNSLLHSMSVLKIRDCELLEKLLKSYSVDMNDIDGSVDVLTSLSILNYSSLAVNNIIKILSDFEDTDYQHTKNYINFIWACVLLNQHTSIPVKHLQKVLSKNFFEKLELSKESLHLGVHLKMLNIIAAVSQVPTLKELLLNKASKPSFMSPMIPHHNKFFMESVKDSLGYIFSRNSHIETLIDTKAGFYLDIQSNLDSKNSPLLFKKKGSCKLGIMLLNYHDFCSDGTLTGLTAFKLNVLTSQGYKVMTISYLDYPINAKLSEKIVYLRESIIKAVNENTV